MKPSKVIRVAQHVRVAVDHAIFSYPLSACLQQGVLLRMQTQTSVDCSDID